MSSIGSPRHHRQRELPGSSPLDEGPGGGRRSHWPHRLFVAVGVALCRGCISFFGEVLVPVRMHLSFRSTKFSFFHLKQRTSRGCVGHDARKSSLWGGKLGDFHEPFVWDKSISVHLLFCLVTLRAILYVVPRFASIVVP